MRAVLMADEAKADWASCTAVRRFLCVARRTVLSCASIQYKDRVLMYTTYMYSLYHVPSYQAFGPLPYVYYTFRGKIPG